ncbi:F-box protein: endocytic membrane traffic, recycling ReCYcling 1 [Irineochytrium annulatum]|nr:F-box protein: endocytic membrane traffic, recycling ReCYcling 1 [Irineochytrium annulatum]
MGLLTGLTRAKKAAPIEAAAPKNLTLASLPPDLVVKAFSFLPVAELAKVARCSRRMKIMAYNDDVYEGKLRYMGVAVDERRDGAGDLMRSDSRTDVQKNNSVSKLSLQLKQLPGGNMLPGGTMYLETGTLWGGLTDDTPTIVEPLMPKDDSPDSVNPPLSDGMSAMSAVGSDAGGSPIPSETSDSSPRSSDSGIAGAGSDEKIDSQDGATSTGSNATTSPQRITAAMPVLKKSNITIGSGGLQMVGKTPSGISIGGSKKSERSRTPNGVRLRDTFKAMFLELHPYFVDFRDHQKDSKVFRDHKDLVEIAKLLRRLRLFSQARFILDTDDITFSLDTTFQWFESMMLGQFERAYDLRNIQEMKRNALACFHLNGGQASVQLFISKNPIFFDQTFNPKLVPNVSQSTTGYALAEEYAKFMDYMLSNCREQASIVGNVFEPEMDAMTQFVHKIVDDSIAQYLTAVLTTARDREEPEIYLHTLATAVHCCTQFVELIAVAEPGVSVESGRIKAALNVLFKEYTDRYMELEVKTLGKKLDNELAIWNKRKEAAKKKKDEKGRRNSAAQYLGDAVKAQAHKRHVMTAMKAILFAPMALGKTLKLMGSGKNAGKAMEAPEDDKDADDATTYNLEDDSIGALVSLELSLKLMQANKEALGRALVIISAVQMEKLGIARLDASQVVESWTEGPDKTVNMDTLSFFELIHIGDLIHQMVDVYYQEDVKPWIDENDFLSELMVEKKSFDRSSDDNVARGMDKAITVLVNQVDYMMDVSHVPADYNPPGKDMVLDVRPTKSCLAVVGCLNAHVKLLQGSTPKDTLEVFLGEVGVRLFNVICKNIKKWQVSPVGAMQLICDLNSYHEWACTLHVYSVSKLFLVLKELGNLYLAEGGTELRNLVHDAERYQGALRPEEIYELLAARTDYKKIQKYVETKECLVM